MGIIWHKDMSGIFTSVSPAVTRKLRRIHRTRLTSRLPSRFSRPRRPVGQRVTEYGYRDYTPGMGRWLCIDPIGIAGGLNPYVLCGNEPLQRIDYDGLLWEFNAPPDPQSPRRPDRMRDGRVIYGLTWEEQWEVKAEAPPCGKNCCKVKITMASAVIQSWYSLHSYVSPSTRETTTVQQHEGRHVGIFRNGWGMLQRTASSYETDSCISCQKAQCYVTAIELASIKYLAMVKGANAHYDVVESMPGRTRDYYNSVFLRIQEIFYEASLHHYNQVLLCSRM